MVDTNTARKTALEIHDADADWFAAQYRESEELGRPSFQYGRKQIEPIFQAVLSELPEGACVLDVGCGTGDHLNNMQQRGFEVHGVEPAAAMRQHAHPDLPPGVIVDGTVDHLPYDDATFDFVQSIEVFRYLSHADNEAGLREIRRVLKPGGVFFGTFVNRYALDAYMPLVKLRQLRSKVTNTPMKYHAQFETPASVESMLRQAGFDSAETRGAMFAPLRLAFRAFGRKANVVADKVAAVDPLLSDGALRGTAGHLVAIGRVAR